MCDKVDPSAQTRSTGLLQATLCDGIPLGVLFDSYSDF
ncbi:hypothetical protein MIZ03_1198 [Rhodoferax lithotrophicus]|uniref:Uncharacterized protein n=1 Tax=Rhodoferax lithotrophicus TaxID=2798804 RepID=A0ABN6D8N4_9BURK|nr:hypothetical protein MIZ03_1198 [Rhodoferax sp. MIZ03]